MTNPFGNQEKKAGALAFFSFLCCFFISAVFAETKLEVNLDEHLLKIYQDDVVIKTYPVAYGRGGVGKRTKGDGKTPLGYYYITSVKKSAAFGFFFHLNYPNLEDVIDAHKDGILDDQTFEHILSRMTNGMAPQNTPLGGYIGIHGLGGKNPTKLGIHRHFNWTQGCIALTDEEIQDLLNYVSAGTLVVIKGSLQPLEKKPQPPSTKAIVSQGGSL